LFVVDLDELCGRAGLLEGLGDDDGDSLMIVIDLGTAEQLRRVVFALAGFPALSGVTMAITPDAALAREISMAAIRPFAIAEPTM
jgi:hypothetical protein